LLLVGFVVGSGKKESLFCADTGVFSVIVR